MLQTITINGFEYKTGGLAYGMTPRERAKHVPGTAIRTNGLGKRAAFHMNMTRSMASDYAFFRRAGMIPRDMRKDDAR